MDVDRMMQTKLLQGATTQGTYYHVRQREKPIYTWIEESIEYDAIPYYKHESADGYGYIVF